MRIRRRSLHGRVPLHNRAHVLALAGGDARLRHGPLRAVLHRNAHRRTTRGAGRCIATGCRAAVAGRAIVSRGAIVAGTGWLVDLGARLFHLNVVVQTLQRDFAGDLVDDDHALLGVVALVALEDGLRLAVDGGVWWSSEHARFEYRGGTHTQNAAETNANTNSP